MTAPRYRAALPVPNLEALWLALEDVSAGGTWLDRSGKGLNATLTSPFSVTGGSGLNGSTGSGLASAGNVLPFERTNPFTLAARFRTTDAATTQVMLSKRAASAPNRGYAMWFSGGAVVFSVTNALTTNELRVTTSGAPITADTWLTVVGTYDGSSAATGVSIYVNGILQSLTTNSNTLSSTAVGTTPLQLASRDGAGVQLRGTLRMAGVWSRVLSLAEVQRMHMTLF